jgi:hypothetical protein
MFKRVLLLAVLVAGMLFIPASADVILDQQLTDIVDSTDTGIVNRGGPTSSSGVYRSGVYQLSIGNVENRQTLNYVSIRVTNPKIYSGEPGYYTLSSIEENPRKDILWRFADESQTTYHSGAVYLTYYKPLIGDIHTVDLQFFFHEWEEAVIGRTGGQQILLFAPDKAPFTATRSLVYLERYYTNAMDSGAVVDLNLGPCHLYNNEIIHDTTYVIVSGTVWEQHIRLDYDGSGTYAIKLERNNQPSNLTVIKDGNVVIYDNSVDDIRMPVYGDNADEVRVTAPSGKVFQFPLSSAPGGPIPEDRSVTVYIKNSQTGALIADANVVIDALVNGEYYPVVNRTEPSGIFSITLQPTGGGQPNPDGYRLIVTADGYNNPMPEINFTVDDYKNYIYCLLDPIAGGPVNENKTFIDFFVRDMSSNPISGATVKFGKYTLITNSAGYTVFEVDKNNNYSWTVSKSGYGPLTGNAVIGDDPRHTINTVLAPVVTPTKPTLIPTSPPIGPTPTMTAPNGEPVSNWLEWFAAHFGMILGGGVEIGKIFMWLCFTVPVGVYVGNQAKAGAAGFMAGAGIVTLFFVLIGWVPIWLLVLLALIIGLLYAKVFNAPDNGGGR